MRSGSLSFKAVSLPEHIRSTLGRAQNSHPKGLSSRSVTLHGMLDKLLT